MTSENSTEHSKIPTEPIEQALAEGRASAALLAACELLELPPNSTPESKVGNTRALAPIGRAVLSVLQQLTAPTTVNEFYRLAATRMSPAAMEFLTKPALQEIQATGEWTQRLTAIADERLSNALQDAVKANELKEAQQLIQLLLVGTPQPQRPAKALIIAQLLGTLVIERDRTQALIRSVAKSPQPFGIDPTVAVDMEEEFQRSLAAQARREGGGPTVGRAELTRAAIELGRALPGKMLLAEPTPEQQEDFNRVLRALWRAALTSPAGAWFQDLAALLVELSPKEVSTAASMAGMEQRLYSTLGRTARTIASRGLETMGGLPHAYKPFLGWAKAHIEARGRGSKNIIELLGLLHRPESIPILKPLLGDAKSPLRNEVIFAIGAIGDPGSFTLLASQLEEDLRGRVVDGAKRREACSIISALGRSTRGLDVTTRNQVLARITSLLPTDDTELSVRVALNFFLGNLEGMDSNLLRWGARVGTAALWSADRPELARAGKNAMLGFRQPLVDLCARLVPHAGAEIRQIVMDMAKQYQPGAYLSLGELWYKVSDPDALPVLQRLVFNTALHDENSIAATRSQYLRSTVRDAATEQQVEIGRDRVLAALVQAIDKCGTPEAQQHLSILFQQAQAGQLQGVGKDTVEVLMKAHQKAGGNLNARSAQNDGPEAEVPPIPLTSDDITKLGDLKATYWLANSRRAKKVAAFVHLGQNKVAAAIEPAMAHLNDSDPIIASAAFSCMVDMVNGSAIPTVLKQQHADALRAALAGKDNPLRVKAAEVIKKVGTQRQPWAAMLIKLAQGEPSLPLRAVLENILGGTGFSAARNASANAAAETHPTGPTRNALGSSDPPDPLAKLPDDVERQPGDSMVLSGPTPTAPATSKSMSALEKKMEYMKARQAWIKGGKKGPEPQPPD